MLLRFIVIGLLALVGLGQVAAIRRLITRRSAADSRQLAAMLVAGGVLLLLASVATRWSPLLPMPVWFVACVAVVAVSAILCGVALFERLRRASR